jgi:hypothetical protein
MTTPNTSQVLQDLRALVANPPAEKDVRDELYMVAKKLALAVESPYDTIYQVVYLVGYPKM